MVLMKVASNGTQAKRTKKARRCSLKNPRRSIDFDLSNESGRMTVMGKYVKTVRRKSPHGPPNLHLDAEEENRPENRNPMESNILAVLDQAADSLQQCPHGQPDDDGVRNRNEIVSGRI
jgi:hypothetical protein